MEVVRQPYPRSAVAFRNSSDEEINTDLAGPSKAHLDPQLRADLADQLRHAQTYDATPKRAGVAAAAEDWMTLDQCRTEFAKLPPGESWYYRNHFSACQVALNIFRFLKCSETSCSEVGRITVGSAFIGNLSHTTRSFNWTVHLFDWRTINQTDPSRIVYIGMYCSTYADGGKCTQSGDSYKTITQWRSTPSIVFNYSTSTVPVAADPHPADKVAHFKFIPTVDDGGPDVPLTPTTIVRCDNASYITGAGCSFTGVVGTFNFDYSYPNYKESVEFVWTALYHLDRLQPNSVGLYVPGGDFVQPMTGKKEPLTRNYYGNTSRTKVRNECIRIWGVDYTKRPDGQANDCDEYPFAASYQNANYDTVGTAATWAVKPVLLNHNRSAGSILGTWFKNDHILDGEPFFVRIANKPAD